jgi:hypothetical protein
VRTPLFILSLCCALSCSLEASVSGTGGGSASAGAGGTSTAGSGGGGGFMPMTFEAVCPALAELTCQRLYDCAPFVAAHYFLSQEDCSATHASKCLAESELMGFAATPEDHAACMSAFGEQSCQQWLHDEVKPAACQYRGTLDEEASCEIHAQCASGHCESDGALCGQCITPVAESGDCTAARCAESLSCVSGICTRMKSVGDACASAADCGGLLGCRNGKCSYPGLENEACGDNIGCDIFQRLQCDPLTERCVPIELKKEGEACTLYCEPGLLCDLAGDPPTCVPLRLAGETCDTSGALPCRPSLECVEGLCGEPAPFECGP